MSEDNRFEEDHDNIVSLPSREEPGVSASDPAPTDPAPEGEVPMSVPEPPPRALGYDVTALILAHNEGVFAHPQTPKTPLARRTYENLRDLILERRNYGVAKYGQTLHTHDGRSGGEDLSQELGDALQYLYKLVLVGEEIPAKAQVALGMLAELAGAYLRERQLLAKGHLPSTPVRDVILELAASQLGVSVNFLREELARGAEALDAAQEEE